MTQYIDWAIGQKFGVMDINVPAYVTYEEVIRDLVTTMTR